MNSAPAAWLETVRAPEPFLHEYGTSYSADTIKRAGRFGFHLVTNEPRRGGRMSDASVICGQPVDPAWDDRQTAFFAVTAQAAAMLALLTTAV